MIVQEKTKQEVMAKAEKMSDFLKMEYLESVILKITDKDTLRYCFLELSRLYEKRHMYTDSIKYLERFEELCILKEEKFDAYLKEIELLIKGELYDRVDFAYNKIKETLTPSEKDKLKEKMITLFKQEGEKQEKLSRYRIAMKAYEKLLKLLDKNLGAVDIKRRLAIIYKKLGMIRESIELERELQKAGYINPM
jgi:tetratricopeptide (TPR) repeat protein